MPSVVVVGAASRDLHPTDPRGWRLGGGVTYSSLALARLGVRVGALIGLDDEASRAAELHVLRAAGVAIQPVALARGPVFDNQEGPSGREQVAHQTADPLTPAMLPAEWRDAAVWLLNPVAGELDDDWADAVPATALVGLGWQGLLRRLVTGQPVERLPVRPRPLIARADIATVSVEDAAGGADVGFDMLLPRAGQQLVVTSDSRLSLHVRRAAARWAMRSVPLRRVPAVRDPTGAGDVFLAAWLAGVLAARSLQMSASEAVWRPLALAAAAAGAKVEVGSLAEMPGLRQLCEKLLRPRAEDSPSG